MKHPHKLIHVQVHSAGFFPEFNDDTYTSWAAFTRSLHGDRGLPLIKSIHLSYAIGKHIQEYELTHGHGDDWTVAGGGRTFTFTCRNGKDFMKTFEELL